MRKLMIVMAVIVTAALSSVNGQRLWRITGPGLGHPSYIYGTYHLESAEICASTPGFEEAFKDADILYSEVNMAEISDSATIVQFLEFQKVPADSSILQFASPAQLDSVARMVSRYTGIAVPFENLLLLKPMAISTIISTLMHREINPAFTPDQQMDLQLQRHAMETGIECAFFETALQQAAILYGSPLKKQFDELMKIVRNEEELKAQQRKMSEAYHTGDLEAIDSLIQKEADDGNFDLLEPLLDNRNRAWVETICRTLPDKKLFIAVGIGHLPGQNGIISLLRARGLTVEPVK